MSVYALLVLLAGLVLVDAPKEPADGIAALAGEWQLVSTQDEKHIDRGCDQIRVVVQKCGRVEFSFHELKTNEGLLKVGRSGTTRWVALELPGGRILQGVYQRDGDELRFCFDEAGKPRPDGLQPKGTQWAERWKRAKP